MYLRYFSEIDFEVQEHVQINVSSSHYCMVILVLIVTY